jgi:hypothetical protein
MKLNLVSFSPESFETTARVGIPKLHICGGRFSLSKTVKDITGFSIGDKVMMHQDEDNPSTWYLSKERAGFEIKVQKNGLAFYSNPLMQTILEAFGEEKNITFKMDSDPIKFNNKDYWKFSPIGSDDATVEEPDDESSEETFTTGDTQFQKKKKTGGRKKGSKNKPKQSLFNQQ